jgi:hypothetical protein
MVTSAAPTLILAVRETTTANAEDAEYYDSLNPPAVDHSLFPVVARSLAVVWKDRPTDSHRWTSGLGGVE